MDAHLRELRYFAAVAEELNFTRAAARLFVSQPALSKQIRALERRLGFELFERRPRALALTEQGAALLPAARRILADWDRAYAECRAIGRPRTLVVGMQTAVGRDLQRRAMARFRERAPGWRISLRLVGWDDPSAGLADATSDVAFVWLPVPAEGIAVHVLARERRWVALPEGHPLADHAEVPFADLLAEPFVALPEQAGPLRDFWLAAGHRDGRPPVIGAEATAADEVFEAVASGLGVALVAEGNAALYRRPGVVCRPVTGLPPAELAVAWRADDPRQAPRAFVACLREAAEGRGVTDARGARA
ncbi:LysR family transcriptional regulator [Thermomonospora cellulosilytica]|uniref:DNA-binding transcriptional LysR family regulator n=1 Tax=Thermomonospora cellulosilytica TaxID=1411118 RepID=A0A7W3N367_9ACTN|nr:LysR substrate-binding domain-containing protein [Thermomonospora cellulosilytica]MBA9006746.1 DNA-binding transcriptional LysR family regulator [Thermomonospora cellulosilytica]